MGLYLDRFKSYHKNAKKGKNMLHKSQVFFTQITSFFLQIIEKQQKGKYLRFVS